MEKIYTKNAPEAVGPYSQATISGNLIFTSGQIPINPLNGTVDSTDIAAQTEQACKNVKAVLESAGSSLTRVIKTTCFIKNMNDFQIFNEVYSKYFTNRPARSCVEVSALPKGVLCEIEAIAEL